MIKNFDQLIEEVKSVADKKTVAVVCAHDTHTLEAVLAAVEKVNQSGELANCIVEGPIS